ncbi:hypothetical protein V6N13_040753 [Hibiscus sabdariffa]
MQAYGSSIVDALRFENEKDDEQKDCAEPEIHTPTFKTTLDLRSNILLEGSFRNFPLNASLKTLALCATRFEGHIPESLGNLGELTVLDLADLNLAFNQLSGALHSTDWSGLSKLVRGNKLSGTIPPTLFGIPSLQELFLSQNQFNSSIGDLHELEGPVKDITSNVSFLDLHDNRLRGRIPFLPRAIYLDYSNNKLNSGLPAQVSDSLEFFYLLSNKFHGRIPPSICIILFLEILDLSDNSLSGSIPQCLFNMSLRVLNLRRNNLSGIMSDTFSEGCMLQTLNLNQNRLEGKVPKSLTNYKILEVLDIENNQIKGTFPSHLKNIDQLHVLVLPSNKFSSHIDCPESNSRGWPMLHIFDIVANNFRGKLRLTSLGTWEAMQPNPYKDQSELFIFPVSNANRIYTLLSGCNNFT